MVLAITWVLGQVDCPAILQSFPVLTLMMACFCMALCLQLSYLIILNPVQELNEVSLQETAH